MDQVRAYYKVTNDLASSGQPTEEQFSKIAEQGFCVLINLAMPTSDFAIKNEEAIVNDLGMSYFHIPVPWETPQVSDVEKFFSLMQSFQNKKVWVHCALNMRASCFIYLYRSCILRLPELEAKYPMVEIWQPSGAWQELIAKVKNRTD
ncbi:MAG: protein tyrosine phosphatase family protein [Pseudomonadota bacterium]